MFCSLQTLNPMLRAILLEIIYPSTPHAVPTHLVIEDGKLVRVLGITENHDPMEGGGLKYDQDLELSAELLVRIQHHLPTAIFVAA